MTALPLALALLLSPVSAPPAALAAPGAVAGPAEPLPAVGAGAEPPLQPLEVVSAFDPPASTYGSGHRGADLAGVAGQQVRSPLPGRVSVAGSVAGRPVVVVDHGEVRTTYQPVRASVAVGDTIETGASLGTLEAGGSHCAPAACLHWGLLRGEEYLDPLTLLGARPVRLLPRHGDGTA